MTFFDALFVLAAMFMAAGNGGWLATTYVGIYLFGSFLITIGVLFFSE